MYIIYYVIYIEREIKSKINGLIIQVHNMRSEVRTQFVRYGQVRGSSLVQDEVSPQASHILHANLRKFNISKITQIRALWENESNFLKNSRNKIINLHRNIVFAHSVTVYTRLYDIPCLLVKKYVIIIYPSNGNRRVLPTFTFYLPVKLSKSMIHIIILVILYNSKIFKLLTEFFFYIVKWTFS